MPDQADFNHDINDDHSFLPVAVWVKKYTNPATNAAITTIRATIGLAAITPQTAFNPPPIALAAPTIELKLVIILPMPLVNSPTTISTPAMTGDHEINPLTKLAIGPLDLLSHVAKLPNALATD